MVFSPESVITRSFTTYLDVIIRRLADRYTWMRHVRNHKHDPLDLLLDTTKLFIQLLDSI